MGVEKVSLSFEPELALQMRELAESEGKSLSAFVADAVQHKLKLQLARELIRDWEAEHGEITEVELRAARTRWKD